MEIRNLLKKHKEKTEKELDEKIEYGKERAKIEIDEYVKNLEETSKIVLPVNLVEILEKGGEVKVITKKDEKGVYFTCNLDGDIPYRPFLESGEYRIIVIIEKIKELEEG